MDTKNQRKNYSDLCVTGYYDRVIINEEQPQKHWDEKWFCIDMEFHQKKDPTDNKTFILQTRVRDWTEVC